MGEAGDAGIEAGAQLLVAAGGMAGGHDHARGHQCADALGRHLLGGQRQQGHAVAQRSSHRDLCGIGHAELARIVRALAGRGDVRAFQVDTEYAGHPGIDRFGGGRDCAFHHCRVVADQGRQQASGAEAPMRARDLGDGLHIGRVVEQVAAAAVDLGVDETRQQGVALQVHHRCRGHARIVRRHQRGDAAVFDQHHHVGVEAVVGKYVSVAQRDRHGVRPSR